jgi:glycine/D-amino acid oxidase-like deaminating enzyme
MDLRSGYPFWLVRSGFVNSFPSARTHIKKEVIVLGGGITGALMAYRLCKAGIDTVVVDKRSVGMGSTCASTALLQYEIDTPLHKLAEYVGLDNAQRSYQSCIDAIDTLQGLCEKEGIAADFQNKQSLYYASRRKDMEIIDKEYEARKQMGIDLQQLTSQEISDLYGIKSPGALLSHKAAQVDPYLMAHGLLKVSESRGLMIVDNTEITDIKNKNNQIQLTTSEGHTITGDKIVYATGYEVLEIINQPIAQLHSTYAIVSEPVDPSHLWREACLLWETATPYLYIRTTPDNRILIGGKDEPFYSPGKRDRLMKRKSKQLLKSFQRLFPHIPFYTDYAWCGTFAQTKDGLPYIGVLPRHPNAYFALGFGGNGITFSTVAAEIICDAIQGKSHADAELFSFDRTSKAP